MMKKLFLVAALLQCSTSAFAQFSLEAETKASVAAQQIPVKEALEHNLITVITNLEELSPTAEVSIVWDLPDELSWDLNYTVKEDGEPVQVAPLDEARSGSMNGVTMQEAKHPLTYRSPVTMAKDIQSPEYWSLFTSVARIQVIPKVIRNKLVVTGPPGEYTAKCLTTVVDWDRKTLNQDQLRIKLIFKPKKKPTPDDNDDDDNDDDDTDPDPTPPPPPPAVPEDEYGNIGQKAFQWAQEMLTGSLSRDQIKEAADKLDDIATRLGPSENPIISYNAAYEAMRDVGQQINGGDSYRRFRERYEQHWRDNVDLIGTREDFQGMLKAIAVGLGASVQ